MGEESTYQQCVAFSVDLHTEEAGSRRFDFCLQSCTGALSVSHMQCTHINKSHQSEVLDEWRVLTRLKRAIRCLWRFVISVVDVYRFETPRLQLALHISDANAALA